MTSIIVAALAGLGLGGCQSTSVGPPDATMLAPLAKGNDQRAQALYISVIDELIQSGKVHAALAHLDEFDHLYGVQPASRKLRSDAWLALGNLEGAEKGYQHIAKGPLAGFGAHGLGRVETARRNWGKAVMFFQIAVNEQPTNPRFLNDLGCAQFQLSDYDAAEFSLRKALELSPTDSEITSNLITLLAKSGRTERFSSVFAGVSDAQVLEALRTRLMSYVANDKS